MRNIIGKCSICGGRVSVPDSFLSTIPPTPTCESCGATARSNLPIIPMKPNDWKKEERPDYPVYQKSKRSEDVEIRM